MQVILGLTVLLEESRRDYQDLLESKERLSEYLEEANSLNVARSNSIRELELRLDRAEAEMSNLKASSAPDCSPNASLANIFGMMIRNPDPWETARNYVLGVNGATVKANKVPYIKHVRELTGCALKEARDFVEYLLDNPG